MKKKKEKLNQDQGKDRSRTLWASRFAYLLDYHRMAGKTASRITVSAFSRVGAIQQQAYRKGIPSPARAYLPLGKKQQHPLTKILSDHFIGHKYIENAAEQ